MSFSVNFGRSFNDYFERIVKDQLGDGYTFLKAYYNAFSYHNAYENGELRIVVSDIRDIQHIYALIDGKLVERF